MDGRKSTMTVALYQGQNAEEVWRRELEQYAAFRHPNLVQVYAMATSGQLFATVFHDDLLPLDETLRVYRDSPISTAYLLGNFAMDAYDAEDHLFDLTEDTLLFNSTLWIRGSTGRLCVQLAPTPDYPISNLLMHSLSADRLPQRPLATPSVEQEAMIISALTLDQYHKICALYTGNDASVTTEAHAMVRVGAIQVVPISSAWCHPNSAVEAAYVVDRILHDSGWNLQSDQYPQRQRALMENGWTRFTFNEIRATENKCIDRTIRCRSEKNYWLPQANHIFKRLHITSCYEEYVLVDSIAYKIYLSDMRDMDSPAYLFVCPLESLQSDDSGRFDTRPDCPAYWALDPLGVDRLTTDDATRLGFPEPNFIVHVVRISWDERVYAGLRQFHAGKGFDPESQDIARYVGVPLYQLSVESDALFAHVVDAGKNGAGRKDLYGTAELKHHILKDKVCGGDPS
ncbi:hypothetical protein DFH06DRAFT_1194580 [Mycena polygramma]|nr:hypothetical protein DFH06DRAFT_1194580 [Mycena polygramma]